MQIRLLTPADADAYFSLRLASLREAPTAAWASVQEEEAMTPAQVAARLAAGAVEGCFGAFWHGELVGIASLKHETLRKIRHRANIWGVYIAPQARRMGVARALVEAIVAHVRQAGGIVQLTLVLGSANLAAALLYASLGFVVTGLDRRSTFIDGQYHDELRMVRFLD